MSWKYGRPGIVIKGPWVCDCADYDLEPQPNGLGECQTCYRPVYDTNGKRITRPHDKERTT